MIDEKLVEKIHTEIGEPSFKKKHVRVALDIISCAYGYGDDILNSDNPPTQVVVAVCEALKNKKFWMGCNGS